MEIRSNEKRLSWLQKKDDESGQRKCLKEGGRADLKGEREAVVAKVSLTGQQVQPEESTKKRAANQLFNKKSAERAINQRFTNLAKILSSWECSEILE
jgi:hypothetical protein